MIFFSDNTSFQILHINFCRWCKHELRISAGTVDQTTTTFSLRTLDRKKTEHKMVQSLSKILWLTIIFAFGTFAQKQKAKEKDHYYGTYIGDFQDRFHGVGGQVKYSFFPCKSELPHSIDTCIFCIVVDLVSSYVT